MPRTVYTSIKDITPNTRNWKIKMIVAEKAPKRTGQNSPINYQKLILIDPKVLQVSYFIFKNSKFLHALHLFI